MLLSVRLVTPLVLTVLAAGIAWAADVYKVGDTVEDATLSMADGTEAKLSANEGSVVVLFFYATWEKHVDESAAQVDTIRRARAKQKLAVIGVARDAKPADAKKFGDDHTLGFPQAADPKSELYDRFATKGLPYVAILDGERKLKHSAAGVDEDAIETVLTDLLGAKDPAPEKKKDEAGAEGGGKK
jgi:peroxiredoxin